MTDIEKIIKVIREQGRTGQGIKLGVMKNATSVEVPELEKEDLYIVEGLKLKKGDTVALTKISNEKYLIIGKVVDM